MTRAPRVALERGRRCSAPMLGARGRRRLAQRPARARRCSPRRGRRAARCRRGAAAASRPATLYLAQHVAHPPRCSRSCSALTLRRGARAAGHALARARARRPDAGDGALHAQGHASPGRLLRRDGGALARCCSRSRRSTTWAVFANLLTPLALVAMFVGEYLLRYRLHPEFERASARRRDPRLRAGAPRRRRRHRTPAGRCHDAARADRRRRPRRRRSPGAAAGRSRARQYLADVHALAERLPAHGAMLNLTADRYRFAVGLGAALLRGHTSLLPPNHTPDTVARLRARFAGTYALADEARRRATACRPIAPRRPRTRAPRRRPTMPRDRRRALVAAHVLTSGSTGDAGAARQALGPAGRATRAPRPSGWPPRSGRADLAGVDARRDRAAAAHVRLRVDAC